MTNLKSAVLQATDGGRRIFEDLYPDSREIFANDGKGYIKLRSEKTASASFKLIENKGERYWIVKDFGDDTTFNAIDAYMHENGIRFFSEALHRLADIYNVDCTLNESINKPKITTRDANEDEKDGDVKYETRPITDAELAVMGPVVTRETMKEYEYYALAWYSICKFDQKTKRLRVTTFHSTEDYPIFLHDCEYEKKDSQGKTIKAKFQKIYKPFETNKAFRFFSIGQKPLNYIFGLLEAKQELETRKQDYKEICEVNPKTKPEFCGLVDRSGKLILDKIIICSGERDAMCLASMGYVPIWFNSESAKKNQDDMDELRKLADKIYNVPDSDETGTIKGHELAREYIDLYTVELPAWLKNYKDSRKRPCKDLRDFIELRPDRNEFQKLLNMAQSAKFWTINPKNHKVEMNSLNLLYFLRLNGFYKLKDEITKETKYIRISGYTVTEYEASQIRDFIRQSLREIQADNAVLETYINSRKTGKNLFDDLDPIEIEFESSDKEGRTFFFQNVCCYVKNNLEETENPEDSGISISYKPTNNKYVWENKIIPHKFTRLKPSFTFHWEGNMLQVNLENNPSKYMRYLINASRLYWKEELEDYKTGIEDENEHLRVQAEYAQANQFNIYGPRLANVEDAWKFQALSFLNKIYAIGYLIHQYKIASSARAIWAMEWKNNAEGKSNGRSGKSLMFQAFEKIGLSEMATLNGRSQKLTDNNHFLDRISKKTDILMIDDADKGFDFGTFYTMITGSITVNPKNEKSFELKYEDAPNIVFTSNFPIPNSDSSTIARILFVAFSDYYHIASESNGYKEDRRVNWEVGDLFEATYKEEEYNADINFIIDCLQFYLCCQTKQIPAINPPMESIHKRILHDQMGTPFLQWAREFFDRKGRFVNAPVIRQAAYLDYCNSIERNQEKKGKNGWLESVKAYVKYCDDLESFNPDGHSFKQKDGRYQKNCIWKGVDKTWEIIYIKTINCDTLSENIQYI